MIFWVLLSLFAFEELLAAVNFLVNRSREKALPPGPLRDQRAGPEGRLRCGLCRTAFNGCEGIALYNILLLAGKKRRLSYLFWVMESSFTTLLFGFFGNNPLALGFLLRRMGVKARRVKGPPFGDEGLLLISFWNGRPFASSLHTVAALKTGAGRWRVFNDRRSDDLLTLLEGRRIAAAFAVKAPVDPGLDKLL